LGLKLCRKLAKQALMYLDSNATSPLDEEVWQAMLPWWREQFFNPSSSYHGAKLARRAIDEARCQVAELLGAQEDEIIFTSGGTESINSVLRSWDADAGEGDFLTTAVEHSAVLRTGEFLPRLMQKCGVDSFGALDLNEWRSLLPHSAFAAAMAVNNETGVIMEWRAAAQMARSAGKPFFCDAVQAVGKIDISDAAQHVDALALSAHKFHGPKGVGAMFLRRGCQFSPLLRGGGQERGLRSGTEPVALIVGMGVAAQRARLSLEEKNLRIAEVRDLFETLVSQGLSGVTINGDKKSRVANTSHLSFDGCEAAGLLILLDEKGLSCSAGSACMSGKQQPSHVQKAMGFSDLKAKSSLRISFHHGHSVDDAQKAAQLVIAAVQKLRSVQGPGVGPVVIYT